MQDIKQFELETLAGTKTIELRLLNILQLNEVIDTLIISASSRDYFHYDGTMIQTLKDGFAIDVNELALKPEYDLRELQHIWLSTDIQNKMIRRIACVERSLFYHEGSFRKAIKDVFGLVMMANMHGANIRKLALPVLGTGAQNISPDRVLPTLVDASKTALEQNTVLNRIMFFEKDSFKLEKLQYEFQSIISEIKPIIVINNNNRTVTIEGKKILFTPFEYCYYLYFVENHVKNLPPVNYSLSEVPIKFLNKIYSLHESVFPEMLGMRLEMKENLEKGVGRDISTFRAYISKINKKIKESIHDEKTAAKYLLQKEGIRGSLKLKLNVHPNKIQIITP